MSVRQTFSRALSLFIVVQAFSWAQPPGYQTYPTARPSASAPVREDLPTLVRQLKTQFADLKHESNNHESEIRIFENKLRTHEASLDQIRQQVEDDLQSQRDFARANSVNLETKLDKTDQTIQSLDGYVKGLVGDLRQLKTQANDSVGVLGQYKQKIAELEQLIALQNQQIQNLEGAMRSLMEVLQPKEVIKEKPSGARTYKVQPGDSLEKIARAQGVSVQTLRDLNQLTNDRILVGQTLKVH